MADQTMRKLAGIICALLFVLLLPISATAQESSTYTMYLDHEPLTFDIHPIEEQDTILVEFRKVFERLGFEVGWDAQAKIAYAVQGEMRIDAPIGRAEAIVNGETATLPAPTRIVNNRTMVSLSLLSEHMDVEVVWDQITSSIYITNSHFSDKPLALQSNIAHNGFVELVGTLDVNVSYIRLDISHSDHPSEIEHIFLEPMEGRIDALLEMPFGYGIYSMKVYTTTDEERYGNYSLAANFKIVYPEDPDLIVIPHDQDPNRYTIRAKRSPDAENALLQIKKLDREAFVNIHLNAPEEQLDEAVEEIEEQVYLAFGSGVYQVNLFEMLEDQQIVKTVTWTHEGNAGLTLSAVHTEDSKVRLTGTVSPNMKEMWIHYANTSQSVMRSIYVPVRNGKVDQPLYLNMGQGLYKIKVGLTGEAPYDKQYTNEIFEVENTDERNRHLLPSEGIESENATIVALASKLTEQLESDADKSLAIHDWVAGNVAIDPVAYLTDKGRDDTALAVLSSRTTDGKGFARLMAALHRAAGIPAKLVSGEVLVGEEWQEHVWNEIYIGDRWVIQDAAWDAGVLNVETGMFRAKLSHHYYDPAPEKFNQDHKKLADEQE
jgi:predicted  nucleic acid-binding Zn-ribbon protein